MVKRIVVDTDIGDDVDDALALAFALTQPEVDIVGITTTFGNTVARARIAKRLVSLYGRDDIPVYAGPGSDTVGAKLAQETPCYFLPGMEKAQIEEHGAIDFMAEQLGNGDVTLVCIGPLTNIATLLTRQPALAGQIAQVVIMGGAYYWHANEWNILCDPESADVLFRSGVKLTAVGLDVTTRCQLRREQLSRVDATNPVNRLLLDMCRLWEQKSGFLPVLHDPLAIYTLLDRSDVEYRDEYVEVELKGEVTRGTTFCGDGALWGRTADDPNVRVATRLDYQAFVEYFLAAVFATATGDER